jgi:NADPH:quinone reductase-like Zn-dependent oxidoreductase
MTDKFKAILITRDEDKKQSVVVTELTETDLMEGDVTVAVEATTVNFKDGLAFTGKAPVCSTTSSSSASCCGSPPGRPWLLIETCPP